MSLSNDFTHGLVGWRLAPDRTTELTSSISYLMAEGALLALKLSVSQEANARFYSKGQVRGSVHHSLTTASVPQTVPLRLLGVMEAFRHAELSRNTLRSC